MGFIKDFLTPILTALVVLAGLAYATGIRDEKIQRLDTAYRDLRSDMKDLGDSVRELNKTVTELNRQDIIRQAGKR